MLIFNHFWIRDERFREIAESNLNSSITVVLREIEPLGHVNYVHIWHNF